MELYVVIARKFDAYLNCIKTGNFEWQDRWEDSINWLVKEYLPSGAGFDSGTSLDFVKSKSNKLVFFTSYHHMNDCGMYDGWTHHDVILKPNLAMGFDMRITGRNRNDIKDYIGEVFHTSLTVEISEWKYEQIKEKIAS